MQTLLEEYWLEAQGLQAPPVSPYPLVQAVHAVVLLHSVQYIGQLWQVPPFKLVQNWAPVHGVLQEKPLFWTPVWHVRQLEDVPPLQVAHVEWQASHGEVLLETNWLAVHGMQVAAVDAACKPLPG